MSDTTTNDGGAAFPFQQDSIAAEPGMSLRDYFAAAALPAIIGTLRHEDVAFHGKRPDEVRINCAAGAYMMADAMLARRGA